MKLVLSICLLTTIALAQDPFTDPATVGQWQRYSLSGFATYDAAVLSEGPLVYYPQREASGTTANDVSGNSYNGTYTSVTVNSGLQWVNGDNAPLYPTSGNRLNFAVTGFNNNFNGDEGALSLWFHATNAALWTDGTARNLMAVITATGSSFQINKHSVANTLRFYRASSSTTVDITFVTRSLGWNNLQVRWKSGEFVKVYYDGVLIGTDTTDIGAWGGAMSVAQLGTYAQPFFGQLGPFAVYTTTNADAFVTTLATVPARLTNMMNSLICDGDSLTFGNQSGATPYPNALQDLLSATTWDMRNFGVAGQTLGNMTNDAVSQVDIWANAIRPRQVVVLWGGSNDIAASETAAVVEERIQWYCSGRKAAGFEVAVCTILPRVGIGGGNETTRTTVNSWIASNYGSFADFYVDLAGDSRLDDYTDTTYYNVDQTHLTTAGYAAVAELVEAAITP